MKTVGKGVCVFGAICSVSALFGYLFGWGPEQSFVTFLGGLLFMGTGSALMKVNV